MNNDPYLWLEDRNGAQAVAWAQNESAITKTIFEKDPRFAPSSKRILDVLTDTDKLQMVSLHEGYAYNLWQDGTHKRGLWRRTPLQSYKTSNPQWEVLLDIDALAASESQPWVFKGATRLPGSDRVMVALSKNNQDAAEAREFSLSTKQFVPGGFFIPESKSNYDWVDRDQLLVSLSLTPDQQTDSGYARKVYLWKRGEDLAKTQLIFEAAKSDVSVWAYILRDQNQNLPIVGKYIDYDNMDTFAFDSSWKSHRLPLPKDASLSLLVNGHVFFSGRSAWKGFTAGSLLSAPLAALAGDDIAKDQVSLVYQPTAHSSLEGITQTKDHLYLFINENVRGQIYEVKSLPGAGWQLDKISSSDNSFYISAVDKYTDAAIFQEEGSLQPRRLLLREGGKLSELKKMKSYFNEGLYTTEQFWVKSKDGVDIPYTVVRAKNLAYDGKNPTLLYGYGGFQFSLMPTYSATIGREWLEQGGVYVVANIRGGGEFGPEWHKAAMKENKQKSYDDFIAIAEDLIARKITSPKHLGIQGGSNGGLLVGAVTMQRPELFNAVVCQIPLLDMIRYTKLPPGASWAGEYGDPDEPKFHEIILKYSPYQNVSATKKYPKIYFQTTQADDRVHPGHARKMAARMKELGHDVLFFESADGGHGGGGVKPEDQARTSAYIWVYLHQQLAR